MEQVKDMVALVSIITETAIARASTRCIMSVNTVRPLILLS